MLHLGWTFITVLRKFHVDLDITASMILRLKSYVENHSGIVKEGLSYIYIDMQRWKNTSWSDIMGNDSNMLVSVSKRRIKEWQKHLLIDMLILEYCSIDINSYFTMFSELDHHSKIWWGSISLSTLVNKDKIYLWRHKLITPRQYVTTRDMYERLFV